MLKLSTLALVLASAFAAPAFAACPDASTTVTFGPTDSGIANRVVAGACTIDDQILDDEQQWGSQAAFLSHVSTVTFNLLKQGKINATERAKLMSAAQISGIGKTIKVKLIGFNDFHGYIKAGEGSSSNPGVARFSTKINELRAQNSLNAVVSAGDMIGASPLTSALFKDEPTIEAMNRIGIDFNAVGNHEFDEGKDELLRMQNGGNHPTDAYSGLGLDVDKRADKEFAGAKFKFLAANVVETASGSTVFPAVGVKSFLGNKVAFIGMTLEGTPTIVSPSGIVGLSFKDEADTVNAMIPTLQAQGIKSVVVLIHEGGVDTTTAADKHNDCTGISGPIVDIVNRLDAEVDLVISGHTHAAYNCVINNKRVTSAGQYARYLSDIDMVIDTRTKNVVSIAATNIATGTTTAEDPALTDLVAHYDGMAAIPKARVIGKISTAISRSANSAGESPLGDVIADAQLDATDDVGFGSAVAAFMNPGGIRADLPYHDGGQVTYGDAFTVQPFGNSLVTMTVSGAQIKTLLETQFAACNGQASQRILQVSKGFNYSYTLANACNDRIGSITINGVAVDPSAYYAITVNSFLADGGDGFAVLKEGTNRLGGDVDTDAFEKYLQANLSANGGNGVAPGPMNRITKN
ncbi:bifunctional metallophosphatase/5'-nucleotidase [Ferribacterium limneticum]|uniref:bifunctional metallophosphatase/5'-nucleotidase n=1 Tax=Ferribacterium limneticum TaxID=76259 RepID=UPI001CFAC4C2|nr:bifunctional metallophosphatase/5'-nucleotidase [Ferribacterium limneticum]UCV29996.1 bifunctional metallophosphatase/5'-nucleotidase [Ferribacterium limneticum]UCV33915.1 bifunctional metallophosphatase/5'-nucleotidase [Ferribacterium limneticum]